MQPIDFLVLAIYFALEAFARVGGTPLAYFFLALALLIGRLLTGGSIRLVIERKTAPAAS
jgi:hypothetical protein